MLFQRAPCPSSFLRHSSSPLAFALFLLFSGCEFSPHQVNLPEDEKNLTQKNVNRIRALHLQPQDTLRFLFLSDTQRAYDETEDFVKTANKLTGIHFVVCAGDISDFGTQKEFRLIHDRLRKLHVPYVTVIGNHDAIGNGKEVYASMYGPYDHHFTAGGHKLIFLNTNSLEFHRGDVPSLSWLEEQLQDSTQYTNALVISHVPPFDERAFDQSKEEAYAQLLSRYGVRASLHGHFHSFQEKEQYGDGVRYILTDNLADRSFLKFTLIGTSVSYEKIDY